jgi:peptide/nickel transport system substrate-binding protein
VVANKGLKNVPQKALYSWEPTSLLGVYRPDEFYWDIGSRKEAMAR